MCIRDSFAMDDIKFMTGYNVEPVVASETAVVDAIGDEEGEVETLKTEEDEIDLGALSRSSEAAPVVKLANVLLIDSLKRGASDIHIEPYEKEFRVRFRIDGILYNIMALPMKLKDPLTSRIKIMSKLDISEKRLPQDCLLYTSPSPRDRTRSRMPSSA